MKTVTPRKGDDVRGFGHQYGTRILEVTETDFRIPFSDHWDSQQVWHPLNLLELETEDEYEGNTWRKRKPETKC